MFSKELLLPVNPRGEENVGQGGIGEFSLTRMLRPEKAAGTALPNGEKGNLGGVLLKRMLTGPKGKQIMAALWGVTCLKQVGKRALVERGVLQRSLDKEKGGEKGGGGGDANPLSGRINGGKLVERKKGIEPPGRRIAKASSPNSDNREIASAGKRDLEKRIAQ